MNTFIVDLKNKPNELARVTEAIAQKGIDITAFSASTCGDSGSFAVVTNDEAGTRRVLDEGKWTYRTFGVIEASIANRPGALAEVARKLGKAGVNVEAAFPTGSVGGTVHLAFATDNPTKAREALGDLVGASTR